MMHVEYGISDISLCIPAIVGRNGIEYHVPIHLSSTAFRFFPTHEKNRQCIHKPGCTDDFIIFNNLI